MSTVNTPYLQVFMRNKESPAISLDYDMSKMTDTKRRSNAKRPALTIPNTCEACDLVARTHLHRFGRIARNAR